eukprot:TRINITY_DN63065_c0_g1_i1.p1 TRINITY_DN63065_c0_g1~~TRINITY_DN63065_c0_g1_i1.p1  ORF type:complete len:262 (+),score=4.54 TRINITY_DN63065_c0_g1_i1:37-822(+)
MLFAMRWSPMRSGGLCRVCLSLMSLQTSALDPCAGDTQFGTCDQDETHRVCAQLLDKRTGEPLVWERATGKNFWQITGQTAVQWDADIRAAGGTHWCICMWATDELIDAVHCDNVHIDCPATDVQYVLNHYETKKDDIKGYDKEGNAIKRSLQHADACLRQRCLGQVSTQQAADALAQVATQSATDTAGLQAQIQLAQAVTRGAAEVGRRVDNNHTEAANQEGAFVRVDSTWMGRVRRLRERTSHATLHSRLFLKRSLSNQ